MSSLFVERWFQRLGACFPFARNMSSPLALRLFMLGACFAIVGLFALTTLHARAVALSAGDRELTNLSQTLSAEGSDTMEMAEAALLSSAELLERHGRGPAVISELTAFMKQAASATPRFHALFFIAADGQAICGSLPPPPRIKTYVRDREYYRYHLTHTSREPYISGPFRDKADGQWVVALTRRVGNSDDSFGGVVGAMIATRYFLDLYNEIDLGEHGIVTLLRANGAVIVRRPQVAAFIGRDTSHTAIFASIGGRAFTLQTDESPLDGVVRRQALRRFDRYPLVQVVGKAQDDMLTAWRSNAISHFWLTAGLVVLILAMGSVLGWQIARRKAADAASERLATFDALTGVANRAEFDAVLEREWRAAATTQTALALLLVDADQFRDYNDEHGYVAGDDVLKAIAETVADSLRPLDLAARYTGSGFAVILPATPDAFAATLAETIRSSVAALGLLHAGTSAGRVSVSIGGAQTLPTTDGDARTLLAVADRGLREAKSSGRDRCVVLDAACRI